MVFLDAYMNSTIIKINDTMQTESGYIDFGITLARNHSLWVACATQYSPKPQPPLPRPSSNYTTTGFIYHIPQGDTEYVYSWAGQITGGAGVFNS